MAKDKKRKKGNKQEGLVSDEARFVLVGLLIFLLCFIGLIERGGYLGNIISYVFVYSFGVFWFVPLMLCCFLGLFLFIRRRMPKIKIGVPLLSAIFLFIFLLIGSSERDISLKNVFGVYNDNFSQIVGNGWKVVIDAQVGGGFVGFVLFSLLSDILTPVGAKLVYILGLILTLFLILKPALFFFVNYIKDDEKYEKKNKEKIDKNKSNSNKFFKNLFDELNMKEDKEKMEVNPKQSFFDEQVKHVSVETYNSSSSKYDNNVDDDFDSFFASRNLGPKNNSEFDVFTDELLGDSSSSKKEEKYETKGYDIFSDDMFYEHRSSSITSNGDNQSLENSSFVKESSSLKKPTNNVVDVSDEDFFTARKKELEKEINKEETEFISTKQTERIQANVFKSDFAPQELYIEKEVGNVEAKGISASYSYEQKEIIQEVKKEKIDNSISENEEKIKETPQEVLTPQEVFDARNDPTMKIRQKPYKLPSINLLNEIKTADQNAMIENAQIKSVILNNKMKSLSINGKVDKFVIAPAFTRYEIQVESNVRVSLFNQYKSDLMMALAAENIRILAPIPGSSVVGIEIPNKERSSVSFKETIQGLPYEQKHKKLLVAMGKDVEGKVVGVPIDKTPHLLVAGTTGSGKSVCINTIIMSILMRTTPDEVKLILVDPKRVELSAYGNMPHLLCPVITDAKKASVALKKVCEEMDLRYSILEKTGKKNIEMYNSWQISRGGKALPYIVVIVDELADLMQVAMSDVEDSIRRITQLARAAGIHLIVATQRPSVDVITGVIKANIPSRCAFTVSSNADSRTILDEVGAENLLGMGDMLLKLTGSTSCQRVQGCFVTDEEIDRVVEFVKQQREPEYDVNFMNLEPPAPEQLNFDGEMSDAGNDPVYLEILDLIKNLDVISASYLQRKFGMGFPKAGRYIDRLEKEGYIGEQQGSKPREVFKQNR